MDQKGSKPHELPYTYMYNSRVILSYSFIFYSYSWVDEHPPMHSYFGVNTRAWLESLISLGKICVFLFFSNMPYKTIYNSDVFQGQNCHKN